MIHPHEFKSWVARHELIIRIVFWLALTLVGAYVLYLRYPYNYTAPNFYAEDGSIFAINILEKGLLASLIEPFNGYLVVGQYLIAAVGFVVNALLGDGIETLPKAFAVASYGFIGAACALPMLLFRKALGTIPAVFLVVMLMFVPVGGWDYAIFGTIGNLKFLFFYIAALLVVYRNSEMLVPGSKKLRFVVIDTLLLLCVVTNVATIFILPFTLYRYRIIIRDLLARKKIRVFTVDSMSLLTLAALSAVYLLLVATADTSAGSYLGGGLLLDGLMNALYRSTIYSVAYPVHTTLNPFVVAALLIVVPVLLIWQARSKWLVLTLVSGAFISALVFVLNRPGVTVFLQGYNADGGPAQFFYANTMLFLVAIFFVLAPRFHQLQTQGRIAAVLLVIIYLAWAAPLAGSYGASRAITAPLPTISQALDEACQSMTDQVEVDIYPSVGWVMEVDREMSCD